MLETTIFSFICFILILAYYRYKENKFNTSQEETIEHIVKIAELLRTKSLAIDGELVELIEWINTNYYKEITAAIITNEKVNKIREKCKLSDEDFYSNMDSLVISLVNILTTRMKVSKEKIEKEMIQEVKKMIKE